MFQKLLRNAITTFEEFGAAPGDSPDELAKKTLILPVTVVTTFTTLAAVALFWYYGERPAAIFGLISASYIQLILIVFRRKRSIESVYLIITTASIFSPVIYTVLLGGLLISAGVFLWGILGVVTSLVLGNVRRMVFWGSVYFIEIIIAALLQPIFKTTNNLPIAFQTVYFIFTLVSVLSIILFILGYYLTQRDKYQKLLQLEQEKSERLLLNVLPKEIVARLKDEPATIADSFDDISVLFADVVGFTPLSVKLSAPEMVQLLNEIFTKFDGIAEIHGLEKIRTIGDGYMVAAGVPETRSDHAQALARMAIEMRDYMKARPADAVPLQIRIGINSGPAIAGVIGTSKFQYDVWGDSVNTASRMESHGVPNKIHITQTTYERIQDYFKCESRGSMEIKGKGQMQTWFLEKARN